MTDIEKELKDLNNNARLLLEKYDGAGEKLDKKTKESLKDIQKLLDGGEVGEAKNALKLGGKSLEEVMKNSSSGVLQIVHLQSPNKRYYYNQDHTVWIPGLTVTLTPKSKNSYFVVMATINGAISHVHSGNLHFRGKYVRSDGNSSCDGNSINTNYEDGHDHGHMRQMQINYAIPNSSLSPAKIRIGLRHNWGGGATSMYINDRNYDDMRSLSHAVIMEVAR